MGTGAGKVGGKANFAAVVQVRAHLEYSIKWMWRERSEEILAHAGDYARAVWNPGRECKMYTSSSLRRGKKAIDLGLFA